MKGQKDFGRLRKEKRTGKDGVSRTVYVRAEEDSSSKRPRRSRPDVHSAKQPAPKGAARTAFQATMRRHLRLEKDARIQRAAHGGAAPVEPGAVIRVRPHGRSAVGGMLGRVRSVRRDSATVELANGQTYEIPVNQLQIAKSSLADPGRLCLRLAVRLSRNGVNALQIIQKGRKGAKKANAKYKYRVPSGKEKPAYLYFYSDSQLTRWLKRTDGERSTLLRLVEKPANQEKPAAGESERQPSGDNTDSTGSVPEAPGRESAPRRPPVAPPALEFVPANAIKELKQYTKKEDYDRDTIEGIKRSILSNGYNAAFPLQVDRGEGGEYRIVSGHHRYTAVRELMDAGELPAGFEIPVIVQKYAATTDRLLAQISENVRRLVKPTDEGRAFGELVSNGVPISEIAERSGKPPGAVQKRLALNNLTADLYRMVDKRQRGLPLGIAEAIGTHGLQADGKPNETIQLRAFRFYRENKARGFGPAELISYMNELKSYEKQRLFDDDGRSDAEKEAIKTVGNEEKAKRNRRLLDSFLSDMQRSFQKMFGQGIGDLNQSTINELSASIVAAGREGDFDRKMAQINQVAEDLQAVRRRLESAFEKLRADSRQPSFELIMAKALRFLDRADRELTIRKAAFRDAG